MHHYLQHKCIFKASSLKFIFNPSQNGSTKSAPYTLLENSIEAGGLHSVSIEADLKFELQLSDYKTSLEAPCWLQVGSLWAYIEYCHFIRLR